MQKGDGESHICRSAAHGRYCCVAVQHQKAIVTPFQIRDLPLVRINPAALRAIRERSGLSVTALAAAAGIKQAHLSNIEAGRRKASADVAVALARALKVELPAILADPSEAPGAA